MPPEDKKEEEKEVKTYTEDAFSKVMIEAKKAKSQRNSLQAELEELKAKNDDNERAALEAKSEYKDLYEAERLRNDELKKDRDSQNVKFIEAKKRSAVNDALGGFKKSEYMNFIDINKVLMDDSGVIDSSTIENEVTRLKQEFPELIKSSKSSRLPNDAPSGGSTNQKALTDMTKDEINAVRLKLIEQRIN